MPPPRSLAAFLGDAPDWAEPAIVALGAAVSLTDHLARELIADCVPNGIDGQDFLDTLQLCDFVVERNSEWHFVPDVRQWLVGQLGGYRNLAASRHALIRSLAESSQPKEAADKVPAYLFTAAGRAYHEAPRDPEKAVLVYAEAGRGDYSGFNWLAGILAEEQQERGVIPQSAIEPAFLRGMTLYREGNLRSAESCLSRVVQAEETRIEVAIALHILGVIRSRKFRPTQALLFLDRSVSLHELLEARDGLLMVLNSRGGVKRDRGDLEGALADLDRAEELGDKRTLMMVLNSRGVVKRDRGDLEGAIADLEQIRGFGRETLGAYGFSLSSLKNRLKTLRRLRNRLAQTAEQDEREQILARFYFQTARGQLVNEKDPVRPIWLLHRVLKLDRAGEQRANALFTLGKCHFRLRQHEMAVRFFNEALAAGYETSELHASLAFAMMETGKPLAEAQPHYEAAIQDTANAWSRSWYALALSAAGKHEEAEAMARSAVAVEGQAENSALLYNFARVLLAMGVENKRKAAVEVLYLAVQHAPSGFDWPQQLLAEIQTTT